jgi:hypothetical protein
MKIANLKRDIIQSIEMSDLGVSIAYIGRLVKLGILKKVSRERYVIQKSPIASTYEALKRGLTMNEY